MLWQYLSLLNAFKDWCLVFHAILEWSMKFALFLSSIELWEQWVCAVTGSSKGLRWSSLSYKASPNLSDPDPEQASSAINGHLNPGGGQHLAPAWASFVGEEKLDTVKKWTFLWNSTKSLLVQSWSSVFDYDQYYENALINLKYKCKLGLFSLILVCKNLGWAR